MTLNTVVAAAHESTEHALQVCLSGTNECMKNFRQLILLPVGASSGLPSNVLDGN
ncbi:hypothetical protein D9M71_804740 [compost metagenome]